MNYFLILNKQIWLKNFSDLKKDLNKLTLFEYLKFEINKTLSSHKK